MRCLIGFCVVVFLVGCGTPPIPAPPIPAPAPPAPDIDQLLEIEQRLVSAHTVARGNSPLISDDKLVLMARAQAKWMADNKDMTHDRPEKFSTRFQKSRYNGQGGGENIAMGYREISKLMDGWMKSPGHRRNILGSWTHIGASYATASDGTIYWCVVFGRTYGTTTQDYNTLPEGLVKPR